MESHTPPQKSVSGFSKLSKMGKIRWLAEHFFTDPEVVIQELKSYWLANTRTQEIIDNFSENTISNFYLPYGVAPNFIINGREYAIPMVTEESSVVAAVSSAAKFWSTRGGIQTVNLGTSKNGQVHFYWYGNPDTFRNLFTQCASFLMQHIEPVTANMKKRGGGVTNIQLIHLSECDPHLYQIYVILETCNSMGANFINTVLESIAEGLPIWFASQDTLPDAEREVDILMSILSNYTPECRVRATVSCPISELGIFSGDMPATEFVHRFRAAVNIAHKDIRRAVTHNKGIYNGVDAVALATGNDFRAIEACGHAYAGSSGMYRSLSYCNSDPMIFQFTLEIPLAVGSVGGLTQLHPITKRSLELLGNPTAPELMEIFAAVGLMQNFAAVKSLVTTGIQYGHMKMHLTNILMQCQASSEEQIAARSHFDHHTVSYHAVREFLESYRQQLQLSNTKK